MKNTDQRRLSRYLQSPPADLRAGCRPDQARPETGAGIQNDMAPLHTAAKGRSAGTLDQSVRDVLADAGRPRCVRSDAKTSLPKEPIWLDQPTDGVARIVAQHRTIL